MNPLLSELNVVAGQGGRQYWLDLWRYRELLYFLAWRDVKVRYKQTLVGASWMLLRPLLMMLVLTLVFHRIAGLGVNQTTPYALVVLAGILPWQFFAATLAEAGNSLVGNAQLISKVYFPRLLVPFSSVLASGVDFLVTLILLLPFMAWYGHWPSWEILLLPLFVALGLIISIGSGIALAALNVRYRDVRFVIPFIVQFGLYVSPVGFRAQLVPEAWRWLYELNPMVGVIEGFRWSLLGEGGPLPLGAVVSSACTGLIILVFGIRYFRRVEKTFADVI